MIRKYSERYISNLKLALDEIDFEVVEHIIHILLDAHKENKQVFIIGNGGSASAASHFACDLAKGIVNYNDEQLYRFRAFSLTDNMATVTAIGNDLSYEDVFVEQLKNYLNPNDVVIVITSTGNSPNILKAVKYANSIGAKTLGIVGFGGGKTKDLTNVSLVVSSNNYGVSEDFHLVVQHIITQTVRRVLEDTPQ